MSSTKVARFGEDELEFAGGILGKPVELVKCETSDILVPANAEMIIEGEVVTEVRELPIPADAASGGYRVQVGLYVLNDGRLRIKDGGGAFVLRVLLLP